MPAPGTNTSSSFGQSPITSLQPVGTGTAFVQASPILYQFASPTNLGIVGGNVVTLTGAINPAANPAGVALYQVTLDSSNTFWRLGVEVDSWRVGDNFSTALALFDSQGNLLKTSTVGRPDYLSDPYLFAGLKPGTYFIGVSSAVEVAGQPGGYNFANGLISTAHPDAAAGSFQLKVVADAAAQPTAVDHFTLNYADPTSSAATGFSVAFSGPMDLATFTSTPFTGMSLVDQNGKSWAVSPSGYQESSSTFSFVFNQALPTGQYALVLPAQGAVADLAGLTPVAPGLPAGTLATFNVAAAAPANPNDLGALFPSVVSKGLTQTVDLAAGRSTSLRFVVLTPGTYTISTALTAGSMSTLLQGSNGFLVTASETSGPVSNLRITLKPGVYTVQFTSGSAGAHGSVSWQASSFGAEEVFASGIGQDAALNLRLAGSTNAGANAAFAAESAAASVQSFVSSTGTTSFAPLPTPGLVGGPSSTSQAVAVVGPGNASGTTALATSSSAVIQGIGLGETLQFEHLSEDDLATTGGKNSPSVDGAMSTVALSQAVSEAGLDTEVVASANWLGSLTNSITELFQKAAAQNHVNPASREPDALTTALASAADDRIDSDVATEEDAGFASPLGIAAVSVIALRLRQPVRNLIDRSRKNAEAKGGPSSRHGPHRG